MTTTTIFHVGQRLTDGLTVDMMVERVGSGSFGEVAMGPDMLHEGRWLAIKVLKPDLLARLGYPPGSAAYAAAEERLHADFLKEALTWRGLWPHPNLLAAQFVVQINGELMLVLDYAEQGSLRDDFNNLRRRGSWLTLDTALSLAQQIAAGLVALHTPALELLRDQPIVHRDLNPNNILLSQYGYAMITDFGLAKLVAEAVSTASNSATAARPHSATAAAGSATLPTTLPTTPIVATATQVYHTQRGAVVGTPAYIAPEQWVDASQMGTAADAYAFGLIVCELLTRRHPLLALDDPRLTLDDCRQAHLTGRPIPLRQLGADTFANERAQHDAGWAARQEAALAQVEALVAKLLAKQAAARPTLPQALTALQAAAGTLGEQPPYTSPEVVYPPTEKNQVAFWHGWAGAYERFGLYVEALPRIERALTLAPAHPLVLEIYASILGGLGRTEEALAVAQQAVARTPEGDQQSRAVLWISIGVSLCRLERYAEAGAALAEATQLAPASADAWSVRAHNAAKWAVAELEAGQVEAARAHFGVGLAYVAEALRLNPDHADYRELEQALHQYQEELRRQG